MLEEEGEFLMMARARDLALVRLVEANILLTEARAEVDGNAVTNSPHPLQETVDLLRNYWVDKGDPLP